MNQGAQIGSGDLDGNGNATMQISTLSVGTDSITARYTGDGNCDPSTSSAENQVVNHISTTTTVTSSANPSTYAQGVTFTAHVSPSAATGTVTFKDNGTQIGTGTLSGGTATYTTSSLVAASHPITAAYGGDSNYSGSTSSTLTQAVNGASLTITASGGAMNYGGSAPTITPSYSGFVNGQTASSLTTQPTCTTAATSSSSVAGSPYSSSCSGAVDSNYSITYVPGSVTVNKVGLTITASSGSMTYAGTVPPITASYLGFVNGQTASSLTTQPTCTTTATTSSPVGSYPTSCSGAVDNNYTITYANGSLTVQIASGAVVLGVNNNPSTYGNSVTLTATVTPSTATGTVTFNDFNGHVPLGGATLSNGQATLTLSTLAPGPHSITATYNGDANDSASTSAVLGQTVNRRSMTLPSYCVY
jgi:hypothetical protein